MNTVIGNRALDRLLAIQRFLAYISPPRQRHNEDQDGLPYSLHMKTGVGLCGAHRVGKTTLALAVAQVTHIPFLKTQTSHLFAERGLNPAIPMPFSTRLSIQEDILSAAQQVWNQEPGRFISDRTPLDMAAYTLADIQGTTAVHTASLIRYLDDCIAKTNRFFSTLIIVSPGIPLVAEPGKAALHEAYIEHIHTLVVGLCHDPRITASVFCIPRDVLSLEDRVKRVRAFLKEA